MKTIMLVMFMLGALCSPVFGKEPKIAVNSKKLIKALIQRENPRHDIYAVGDKRFKDKAYGLLQIRKPYLQDAEKIAGKKLVKKLWGKKSLTVKDMRNTQKAKWVTLVYLSHYGTAYTKTTGKKPTVEVYARIHNGGPLGWKKWDTRGYGKFVASEYAKKYRG